MSDRNTAPIDPEQAYRHGCFMGRHMLANILCRHNAKRAAERIAALGRGRMEMEMASMQAHSDSYNDHMHRSALWAPHIMKP